MPEGKQAIGCKWVFVRKRDLEGAVSRYKARLVAQGFAQRPGDYGETFSPVVAMVSMQAILALCAHLGWEARHWDTKSAFLFGEKLEEDLYMKQPIGFSNRKGVLKLIKPLYGLKQAGHQWNKRLHALLSEIGFGRLDADACVYLLHRDGGTAILGIHVDDMLGTGDPPSILDYIFIKLNENIEVNDLGAVKQILGVNISRDKARRTVTLSQKGYVNEILHRFGMV